MCCMYSMCPFVVKCKESQLAQELLCEKSAEFLLGCRSIYSVRVSWGSEQEGTGPADSKAPAQTPAQIPRAFLWTASLHTTRVSTRCACFTKQDLQGVHVQAEPAWPVSPSVSRSSSQPQNRSAPSSLKNCNQSGRASGHLHQHSLIPNRHREKTSVSWEHR